jgi:hypothetical protein
MISSNNIPSHQFSLLSFFFHNFRLLKSYLIVLLYVAKHQFNFFNRIEFHLKNHGEFGVYFFIQYPTYVDVF